MATISRMLKNIGLFCKRDLQKRPIFCKETYIFKHPTHRSHPIIIATPYKGVPHVDIRKIDIRNRNEPLITDLRDYCKGLPSRIAHTSSFNSGLSLSLSLSFSLSLSLSLSCSCSCSRRFFFLFLSRSL